MNKKNVIAKTPEAYQEFKKQKESAKKINVFTVEPSTGIDAYRLWHQRINDAIKWRQDYWNGDKNWEVGQRMYRGDHWQGEDAELGDATDTAKEQITVNLTLSTIGTIGSFLMNKDVQFVLKPKKPEANVSAMLQQAALNDEWERGEMTVQVRKCVDDAMTIGHCVARTGFTLDVDEAVLKAQGEIEYKDYIREESPYLRRVNPKNFFFDPSASEGNLETARWCLEIFFVPISDILANSDYDKSVIAKIKSGECQIQRKVTLFSQENKNDVFEDQESEEYGNTLGVLFEVWDKKHKKMYVFAGGVDEPLLEKKWPYEYLKEFP